MGMVWHRMKVMMEIPTPFDSLASASVIELDLQTRIPMHLALDN